ncbi:MAG: hypothetical protein Fur002_20920 [Anaerolineales bacterium]
MKKSLYQIALAAFLLPILARGLFYYRGIAARPEISTPDYAALQAAPAPLKTPAAENKNRESTRGTVLFDATHGNQFTATEVAALSEAIAAHGGAVEFLSDSSALEYKLKYASAFVVVSPSVTFYNEETRLIKDFTAQGGRLLVFTDATRGSVYENYISGVTKYYSDATPANSLLTAFDITVNDDYLYDLERHDSNFRNVLFDQFGKAELVFGMKQAAFYGAHSLTTFSGTLLLQSAETTRSSIDDAHHPQSGGAILSADGNALALGDFTFLSSPYDNMADNAVFIKNIADFALNGKRNVSLKNFPFVFQSPEAQVYLASDVTLSTEVIGALSGAQSAFAANGIALTLTDKIPTNGDVLVLATFTPNEEIAPYLQPFDITLDDSELIQIPKLGDLGRYGSGLLLFQKSETGNTLLLLANSPEDLVSFVGVVASGSLDACVLQGDLGVCSVGYGGEYNQGGGATPEPALTPAPEVTPQG